jgi:hypothetical protein
MDKKNIIQLLENKFVEYVAKMDASSEQQKRVLFATMACEVAEVLAKINGCGIDEQHNNLYNKYNLWKFEN